MNDAPNPMDPHGWLTRIPELERFASDPEISRAIAAGDPRKLHASLEARRRKPRTPMEVQALDRLLGDRRAFAMPVVKAPSLYTLNGIGQRIYGKGDARPDGTFIGTLYATLVYLPIYPIAQYVLARDGSRYAFVGELPLTRGMVAWRRATAAVAVAGIAAIAATAWWSGRYAEVQLLNGLDIPVTVTAASEKVELAPGARATRRLEVGRATFRATTRDGKTLEEVTGEIPRSTDLVAYNVLGAAPLAVEAVVYTSDKATPPRQPAPAIYGGRSFATRDGVQYLFRDPPAQLKLSSGQKSVIKWHALVPDGGWRTSATMLFQEKRLDEYAVLSERIALLQPENPGAAYAAVRAVRLARGPAAGLEVARRIASALPEALEPQRVLVASLLSVGRRDEARQLARERLAKAPESMLAGYLSARVEPLAAGTARLRELVTRFPDAAQLRGSLAWHLLAQGSAPAALDELDRHDRLAPDQHRGMLDLRAEALVLAGRPADAARAVLEAAGKDPTFDEAVLYTQLGWLAGAGAPGKPEALLKIVAADEPNRGALQARTALLLGLAPPDEKTLAAIPNEISRGIARVEAAAGVDPAAALKQLATAHITVVGSLDDRLAMLLAAEAARTGAAPLATRLLEAAFLDAPPAEILSYASGGPETPLIASLSRAERAVLRFARSRAAPSAAAARAEEAAAKALEPLHGLVWQAAKRWPAVKR